MFLRFADGQESRSARPCAVAAAGVGFALPPSAYDRLPAIDLPVANAMIEKLHERSMHRSRIQD
jgi:hypothetical protein